MDTEAITVTNRNGPPVTMMFDETNVLEDDKGIAIRIPTAIDSAKMGRKSLILIIHAGKSAYNSRTAFLRRVDDVGKQQVAAWLESSADDAIVLPLPDVANAWGLAIDGPSEAE